mmetsp:Transcript_154989/g.496776  ORF Transcript_154989/g.496776 Transcript_154989/m.496776 type:complete len:408 (+) Transcript_154989:557-1780(+)
MVRQHDGHATRPQRLEEAHGPSGTSTGHQAEASIPHDLLQALGAEHLSDRGIGVDRQAGRPGERGDPAPHIGGLGDVRPELACECRQELALTDGFGIAVKAKDIPWVQVWRNTQILQGIEWRKSGLVLSELIEGALKAHLGLGGEENAVRNVLPPRWEEVDVVEGKNMVRTATAPKVRQVLHDGLVLRVQLVELVDARDLVTTSIRRNEEVIRLVWIEGAKWRAAEKVVEPDVHAPLAIVTESWRASERFDDRHVVRAVHVYPDIWVQLPHRWHQRNDRRGLPTRDEFPMRVGSCRVGPLAAELALCQLLKDMGSKAAQILALDRIRHRLLAETLLSLIQPPACKLPEPPNLEEEALLPSLHRGVVEWPSAVLVEAWMDVCQKIVVQYGKDLQCREEAAASPSACNV